jgi:hypothetical protein
MKRLLLAGVAFAALIAPPATAADLAPVYKAPRAALVVDGGWSRGRRTIMRAAA